MIEEVKENGMIDRCQSYHTVWEKLFHIELLVLGVLRVSGRAWCFDDIEEKLEMSQEVHCTFPLFILNMVPLTCTRNMWNHYIQVKKLG